MVLEANLLDLSYLLVWYNDLVYGYGAYYLIRILLGITGTQKLFAELGNESMPYGIQYSNVLGIGILFTALLLAPDY